MKQLKDYLHFYLQSSIKCQRMGTEVEAIITGISYDDTQKIWWAYFENEEEGYCVLEDVFPILRPLSDMTEEEYKQVEQWQIYQGEITASFALSCAECTAWMLKQNFDVFNLIKDGLAIDKATLL